MSITHTQLFAQLQNPRRANQRSTNGPPHEINIRIGGDGEWMWSDHGEGGDGSTPQ